MKTCFHFSCYLSYCVLFYVLNEFSKNKKLKIKDAFNYLNNYKGIDYLLNNYNYEHTLGIHEILDDVTKICLNNGGNIN